MQRPGSPRRREEPVLGEAGLPQVASEGWPVISGRGCRKPDNPALCFPGAPVCVNVPNLTFVILSQLAGPGVELSLWTVGSLVTLEKFGYSFGFVANMLYMMQQISPGRFHMTHYAYCTALMNLVLAPTQMISGPLADHLGCRTFFIIVTFASIPSVVVAWFPPFPRKINQDGSPRT